MPIIEWFLAVMVFVSAIAMCVIFKDFASIGGFPFVAYLGLLSVYLVFLFKYIKQIQNRSN